MRINLVPAVVALGVVAVFVMVAVILNDAQVISKSAAVASLAVCLLVVAAVAGAFAIWGERPPHRNERL